MIVRKTTKEVFDKSITLIAPKKKNEINLYQLTPGEIVALWWRDHHKKSAYVPKYFKQIYAIDMNQQTKIFEKEGYVEAVADRYQLTEKGQNLLDSYAWIIQSHRDNVGIFNSGRRLLSQKDISKSPSTGSGFSVSSSGILPNEFISLDIETTGLSAESGDHIIQLSATHVLNNIELDYFDTLISNPHELNGFIQNLTGISNQDLVDAPTLSQVTDEFMRFIGDLPIIGWNIKRFDVPFLAHYGIVFQDNEIIDLMYISRRYNHGGTNNTLTTVKRMTGVKSLAHNSLADARATVLVGKLVTKFKPKISPKHTAGQRPSSLDDFNYEDDSPIFEGLRFVFTGSIEDGQYNRPQMQYIVEKHGGKVTSSLSKNVNYFIQGVQTSSQLVDGIHSRKELTYIDLRNQGVDIYKTNGQGFDQLLTNYKRTALL